MSQEIDKKSARKYWWIIMLLPVGLAVGTITGLYQHLRKDQTEQEQAEFKVATDLNVNDLYSVMRNARDLGTRDPSSEIGRKNIRTANRFIQSIISPGGTGQQFSKTKLSNIDGQTLYLNHTDIKGTNPSQVVAVVIELEGSNTKGNTTKLAIFPSLVRSLLEAKPNKTIRFILTPQNQPLEQITNQIQRKLIARGETLASLILLREKPTVSTADSDDWTLLDGKPVTQTTTKSIITHTVLHNTPAGPQITQSHQNATLQAATKLKALIIELAQ